jgi:2-polyprenyl-3-methyl-5-hydroxy-6-metoxy-1,4-benzoquinol methylase
LGCHRDAPEGANLTEESVRESYIRDGEYKGVYYQDVPELGLNGGSRKSLDRIKSLALDRIDFKNKSVLDIGCAGGFFCRYAFSQGARYVRGVDLAPPVKAAQAISDHLGMSAIDYEVADLKEGYDEEFDIVFFLSVIFYVGIPESVKTAQIVIFEDNTKENKNDTKLGEPWGTWFSDIKYIGSAADHINHDSKPVYHLRK